MAKLQLAGVRENVPLKDFTTFKIGGPARYLLEVKSDDVTVEALRAIARARLPALVLGEGSNVLIADAGFPGLVILDRSDSLAINGTTVAAGSGLKTMALVERCAAVALGGMEFMAGIPGTVGAAVRGNAGAWGHAFGELLTSVTVYREGEVVSLEPPDLKFAYRWSILRERPWVVLGATLRLTPKAQAAIAAAVQKVLADRAARLPVEPSIGSIFKNIELAATPVDVPRLIAALDITPAEYAEHTRHGKLPIGFLTEALGLKGTRIGGAQLSPKHGNIIVNPEGRATADDVVQLIALIKTRVRNQLGIQLQEEIQYVGF